MCLTAQHGIKYVLAPVKSRCNTLKPPLLFTRNGIVSIIIHVVSFITVIGFRFVYTAISPLISLGSKRSRASVRRRI